MVAMTTTLYSCSENEATSNPEDIAQVKETFKNYAKAVINSNGKEALECLSSETIQYYGDLLELVKNADSVETDQLDLLDKMNVLIIRQEADAEVILSMDDESIIIYAVDNGIIGKESMEGKSIGEVEIKGDEAFGEFLTEGKSTPFKMRFQKENGEWKLDITSIFDIADAAFKHLIKQSEMSENDYFMMILQLSSEKTVTNNVWHPVK